MSCSAHSPHDAWHIRRAHAADHAALLTLWEQSVRATHDFLTEDDIIALRPTVGAALGSGELELFVLATPAGAHAGWLGVASEHIEALFLAPAARGNGGGRRLLEHAQGLRPHASLTVDVNEQNPQARGFYERLGFAVTGRCATDSSGRPFPLLHMRRAAPPADGG